MTKEELFAELNLAREYMGSRKTTIRQWETIIKRLGMLLISPKTPDQYRYLVEGNLQDAMRRKVLLEVHRPEWLGLDNG